MSFSIHPSPSVLLRGILAAGLALPAMAQSPLQIKTDNSSIKFGFLFQPQYESVGSPTKDGESQNFFLRRTRFLMAGTLGSDFEYFFETESANMGKSDAAGAKTSATMVVQDAVITWKANDAFKVDTGLILIPFAHNSLQSAASLLSWDYYSYSFSQNGPFATNVGRDLGVQFRGLIAKKFEYRLGAFQGKRNKEIAATTPPDPNAPNGLVQSRNAMRIAGRLQYNVFDAENGMFYAGSYAGAKKILSFGVGYDKQDDYTGTAYDVFFDWPLANKDVVTFQLNHVQYDGGTWIALPKQSGTSAEAGYRFSGMKFSPILRWEKKTFDIHTTTNLDETRIGGGLAFWLKGNNANVKIFYNQIKPDNVTVGTPAAMTKQHSYNQFNVQLQYFIF
ncbi:MAG: hypothetical protein IPP78_09265 [Holophagaceae bacterium]|nr:hypothetical protein [Holophagaceae bacterium]